MSLITVIAFSGEMTAELVMPVNAALASREFVAFGFAGAGAGPALRAELAIQNCKADSGATFTARFSQPVGTATGYFTDLLIGTFLARADQLTTLTATMSGAFTGPMMVCYNEIPLGGSDRWTARV